MKKQNAKLCYFVLILALTSCQTKRVGCITSVTQGVYCRTMVVTPMANEYPLVGYRGEVGEIVDITDRRYDYR